MAKTVNDNVKWGIGIILTAASLAFGTNLYDRFVEERRIAFDVRTEVPRSGIALLRIENPSAKSCGPVTIDFTANAVLKAAKFRKLRPGDEVQVSERSAEVNIAQLAARNGRVLIDFEYDGLTSDVLEFQPADVQVGCGAVGYDIVEFKKHRAASPVSSRWIVVGVLVAVILIVSLIAYFGFDPFRV
jgi:hypothetical protein